MASEDQDFVILNRSDVEESDEDIHLPLSDEKCARIQAWLDPTDYAAASSEYGKHIASHLPGTGTWIFQTEQYRQWHNSRRGALWVKAIAGAGKSVIAATLVSKLRSEEHVPVLYFFFRHIISANQTPDALVRDYLSQVLQYCPSLQHKLDKMIEDRVSLSTLSLDQSWKILVTALKQLPKVYCVVDALDEMDAGNESFLQKLLALSAEKPQRIKVMMTSRPVPRVEQVLKDPAVLQIILQPRLIDPDIFAYVRHRVNQFDVSEILRCRIHETMCAKADGHFLYARLMMNDLYEITRHSLSPEEDLHLALDRLPIPMNDMYTQMLADHSRRSGVPRELQIALLQWVTRAERPVRLIELAAIISFEKMARGVSRETKSIVREGCGPLLEILEDETVCPIHHSFTEYLYDQNRLGSSSNPTSFPVLDYVGAQYALADACIKYLCSSWHHEWNEAADNKPLRNAVNPDFGAMKLRYPFLEYAANNWHRHVVKSADAGASLTSSIETLLLSNNDLLATLIKFTRNEKFYREKPYSITTYDALRFAATNGLKFFTGHLINEGYNVNHQFNHEECAVHLAARKGHGDVLTLLIDSKAEINSPNDAGLTPMHMASSHGHAAVVKTLLECGVDPFTPKTRENPGRRCGNAVSTRGETPVQYACRGGHVETVQVFLPYLGADRVNQALHWALASDQTKVVMALLESGQCDANLEIRTRTPLFLACQHQNIEVMRTLLDRGASVHVLAQTHGEDRIYCWPRGGHRRDISPLHTFARTMSGETHRMIEGFELLLNAGIDSNIATADGTTILHLIVKAQMHRNSRSSVQETNVECVLNYLFARGLSATATTSDGSTALHHVSQVSTAVIDVLIAQGTNINQVRKKDGRTPLMAALESNDFELARHLLHKGADPNVTDKQGNNPLHILASSYHFHANRDLDLDLVKMLVKAGVNMNKRNAAGDTPLHVRKPDDAFLDYCLEQGYNLENKDRLGRTLLIRSVSSWSNVEFAKKLVKAGVDIHTRDASGSTVLHAIVQNVHQPSTRNYHETMLKFFIEQGLDPLATDNDGNTLWHMLAAQAATAFNNELLDVRNALSKYGVSPHNLNIFDQSPLHVAFSAKISGRPHSLVEHLLAQPGTDVNAGDGYGLRPLHYAVAYSVESTYHLLNMDADPSLSTYEGLTPLMVACRNRQCDTVCLLLDHYKNINSLSIDQVDHLGRSALHFACKAGRPETVAMLIEAGADVNLKDTKQHTPLHACAEFLNEQRAWESAQATRLHNTARQSTYVVFSECVRPDLHSLSNDPLRVRESIRLLVEHGADTASLTNLRENKYYYHHHGVISPLEYAIQQGCEPAVSELLMIQNELLEARLSKLHLDGTAERELADQVRDEVVAVKESVAGNLNLYHNKIRFLKMQHMPEIVTEMFEPGKSNRISVEEYLRTDDEPAVEQLIKVGAELTETDNAKMSGLSHMCAWGFTALLRKTVQNAGLKIVEKSQDITNSQPGLLLHTAFSRTIPNMSMVKLLVSEFGFDIKQTFSSTNHPIRTHSFIHQLAQPFHWWQTKALEFILENGCDVNGLDSLGQTPLKVALQAFQSGNYHYAMRIRALEILLTFGANANAVDPHGQTCLNLAMKRPECAALLLKYGADPMLGDKPFIFDVVKTQNLEILSLVIQQGIDVNILTKPIPRGKTDLENSGSSSDDNLLEILSDTGHLDDVEKHVYPIHIAASHWFNRPKTRSKAIKAIQMLLEAGANPFLPFKNGNSIIHFLAQTGGVIEPFFDHMSFDIESRDEKGRTILLAACENRALGVVHQDVDLLPMQLIRLGASLTAVDSQGRNALHCLLSASPSGKTWSEPDLASLLDALLPTLCTQPDFEGRTPIHYALSRSQFHLIDTLIDHGADPLVPDPVTGQTALHYLAAGLAEPGERLLLQPDEIEMDNGQVNKTMPPSYSLFANHIVSHDVQSLKQARARSARRHMQTFLAQGLSINDRDHRGETPVFKLMIVKPSSTNEARDSGDSLLLWALQFLEGIGANFAMRNNSGESLLHRLATQTHFSSLSIRRRKEHVERRLQKCFSWLMERGVDIGWEDENARTCLDVAAAMEASWALDMFKREQ